MSTAREPFPAAADDVRRLRYLSWGIRRVDGAVWDPEQWILGDESTADGLVLVASDLADCAAMLLGQNVEHEFAISPGEVYAVRLRAQPGSPFVPMWNPVTTAEVIAEVRRQAALLTMVADRLDAAQT